MLLAKLADVLGVGPVELLRGDQPWEGRIGILIRPVLSQAELARSEGAWLVWRNAASGIPLAAIPIPRRSPMPFNAKPLQTRFDWILRGAPHGPDDAFDEDLARYAEAAVIPTRGALVAGWLLVVPRTSCLSVAELGQPDRVRLLAIADEASARMSVQVGTSVMFEHGPGRVGTAAGCGVDQAHLHVVGGAPDLLDNLIEQVGEMEWSEADHADPWATLPSGSDYLMIRNRDRAVRAIVDDPTPQRLRRALAEALGRGHEWDYRLHPNASNARRTKEMFSGAFADANT